MNPTGLNNLVIVLLCGSLFMLAFIVIANPGKVNRKANRWFGAFLLVWATFWLEEIAAITGFGVLNNYFTETIHYLQIFLCFFYYLAVSFYINPEYRFRWSDTKHLVIPAAYLLLRLIQKPDSNNVLLVVLVISQSILYTTITFLKIRRHQKKIGLFSSNKNEIDLRWLEYIIAMLLGSSILFAAYSLLYNASAPNLYINSAQLVAVLFVGYFALKQKEIYPLDQKQRVELIAFNEEPVPDPKRKIVPDEEINSLKTRLLALMEEQKPYLDSNLNLVKLAEQMAVSTHQLSYVINTGFSENFFQFINKYRVEKAKELLLNSAKDNYTILGIAFESGFNSKTSFNTTFKKFTDLTPSEYKKKSTGL
ncbi:MAG TPA: helix-turn-helix domain-containing protein [Chitinophagaceae bacterium]